MSDRSLKVGQNACEPGGINFTDNAYSAFPKRAESEIDFTRERFPQRSKTLAEWKDLSTQELLRHLEDVHKEIFRRLGS